MGTRSYLDGHHQNGKGEPIAGALVYLYQQGTTTPITETIFANDSDHPTGSATTLSNPITTATDGLWSFYLAAPKRVTIKIVTPGGLLQDVTRTRDVNRIANDGAAGTPGTNGTISRIENAGVDMAQRSQLNFTGATVTDDAAGDRTTVAIPAGVTAHSALTGLSADDHTQYYNQTRGDARYIRPAIAAIVNADVNAAAAIAESKLSLASDAAAGTASRRTLGTGATQAAAGSHTHAQLHNQQHSVTAAADHTFPGGTTTYLRADGTFTTPPAGDTDIWIPATDMLNPSSTQPYSTIVTGWFVRVFSSNASDYSYFSTYIPSGWVTANVVLYWARSASGVGDVVWRFKQSTVGDGEAASAPATDSAALITAPPAAGLVKVTTLLAGTAVTAGKMLGGEIRRWGDNASDTLLDEAFVYGIRITKAS